MGLSKKIRGGGPELTQLKELWQTLDEDAREYWRGQFRPRPTARELRAEIAAWFHVTVRHEFQLVRFRRWVRRQEERRAKEEINSVEKNKDMKFMKVPRKPNGTDSGEPETPMQRMKDLWKKMPEAEQDEWRTKLTSSIKLSVLRAEVSEKYGIVFNEDTQLSRLYRWIVDQDERDARRARMQENERRFTAEHPDWTKDRVRAEVIRHAYFETLESGDFKLGLSAAKVDLSEMALDLRKIKQDFDAAEACLKHLPEVKRIANNPRLSQREKINQIRRMLFGELPEDVRKEKQNEENRN